MGRPLPRPTWAPARLEDVDDGPPVTDAVVLAQRLAALLEGGRQVATYKPATLLALRDACAEATPTPGPADGLSVSILDLADRVIDLYWPQVRVFGERGVLRQSSPERAIIVDEVRQLLGPWPETAPGALRPIPHGTPLWHAVDVYAPAS